MKIDLNSTCWERYVYAWELTRSQLRAIARHNGIKRGRNRWDTMINLDDAGIIERRDNRDVIHSHMIPPHILTHPPRS